MKNKLLNFSLKLQMVGQLMRSKEWFIVTRESESVDPVFCHGEISGETLKKVNSYIHIAVLHKTSEHE